MPKPTRAALNADLLAALHARAEGRVLRHAAIRYGATRAATKRALSRSDKRDRWAAEVKAQDALVEAAIALALAGLTDFDKIIATGVARGKR